MPNQMRVGGLGRAAGVIALLAWSSCSSDLGSTVTRQARAQSSVNAYPATAFDPGVPLGPASATPITAVALAGAVIPQVADDDVHVALTAFVTSADLAGGNDTNGVADVYLAAVVNGAGLLRGRQVPSGFVQGIAPVMRDPRCINCHSFHVPVTGFRLNPGHGTRSGEQQKCVTCHTTGTILDPAEAEPARPMVWTAPPPSLDLRGLDDDGLYRRALRPVVGPVQHMLNDERILWAIGHGRVPSRGLAVGGSVPMSIEEWRDLVRAWAAGGLQKDTGASTAASVTLVSRANGGTNAGNAASRAPSLTYVPDAAYDPHIGGRAGTVYVAFASDAGDVESPARNRMHRQVYRTGLDLDVQVDQGRVSGMTLAYSETLLVSVAAGDVEGDADSDSPAISGDGTKIAFCSLATNLASLASGTAAVSQVLLADVGDPVNIAHTLCSRSIFSPSPRGGDGASAAPAISGDGTVVAFESDATDLVAGDGNGQRDVFYARDQMGIVVRRASVAHGGVEVTGGASTRPGVWHDASNDDVWVTFESTARGLDPLAAAAPERGAYVHWSNGAQTVLATRQSGAPSHAPAMAADGSRVVFVADADLDPTRPNAAGGDGVFSLDLRSWQQQSAVAAFAFSRMSVNAHGESADRAAKSPVLGGCTDATGRTTTNLVVGFRSIATNLGGSANSDLLLQFARDLSSSTRGGPPLVASFMASEIDVVLDVAETATVAFTDLSTNASAWSWDFDGDSNIDSTEQNPRYTYTRAGTFHVRLTVTGFGRTAVRDLTISVRSALSWPEIYNEILTQSCTDCHHRGGAAQKILFADQNGDPLPEGDIYAELLTGGSEGVGKVAYPNLVVPGDPANSLLLVSISPGRPSAYEATNTLMPLGATKDRRAIQKWILAGAPRTPNR